MSWAFIKLNEQWVAILAAKKMQKDDVYLKIELATNRKNYCEDCFEEWVRVQKGLKNESQLV